MAELATTSFAFRNPTKAMNIPIPAAVECFRQSGMPFDDLLANARDGEHKEENARTKNHRERGLPRNMHRDANGISEVRVQRHSRSQRDGVVGIQSHHQRRDRGGNAGCKDDALGGHPGLSKNLRDSPR